MKCVSISVSCEHAGCSEGVGCKVGTQWPRVAVLLRSRTLRLRHSATTDSLEDDCIVVAPSLIPRRPGERIKTDRRDAINLAKLHRAGELTPVWVPDEAHEAIRDLVRARLAAVRTLRQARQQLSSFLLRHGHHYNRPAWTLMHRRWPRPRSPLPPSGWQSAQRPHRCSTRSSHGPRRPWQSCRQSQRWLRPSVMQSTGAKPSPASSLTVGWKSTTTSLRTACELLLRAKEFSLRRFGCRRCSRGSHIHPRSDGKAQRHQPGSLSQQYADEDRRGSSHQQDRPANAVADELAGRREALRIAHSLAPRSHRQAPHHRTSPQLRAYAASHTLTQGPAKSMSKCSQS